MYVSESDIFRMARLLFMQNGIAAVGISVSIAEEISASGDISGAKIWRRIAAVMPELIDGKREDA